MKTLSAILLSLIISNAHAGAAMTETQHATAMFAGGCFWCMEAEFEALDGVEDAVSGYTGGSPDAATYEHVSRGSGGHREAVQVNYDPSKVNYAALLDIYISNVDPFDASGQFCDKGFQYTPAIYAATESEHMAAQTLLENVLDVTGRQPVIALEDAGDFYPAEEYHQDFHRKNALRYNAYKNGCGRKERLRDIKKIMP